MRRFFGGEKNEMTRHWKTVLLCTGIGMVATAVVLMGFALVMSMRDVPQALIDPMAVFALCIGAFLAGLLGAKGVGRRGMLIGMLCAALMFVLVLAVGTAAVREGFGPLTLVKLFAMLLCGAIGGILGINTKKRRG